MKLSNDQVVRPITTGCGHGAVAIRAAAFALLLCAALPVAAQTAHRLFASGFEGGTTIVPPNQANFWGTGG